MKIRFFVWTALTLVLAACNKNNEEMYNDIAAQFTAAISKAVSTRASGTTWDTDDCIGITGAGYSNVPYVREGDQFVPQSSAIIYFQTLDPQTFSAYYPYDANGGILSVMTGTEAQQDQSAIDFLYATGAEGNASSPEVKFINENAAGETDFTKDHSFHHCMSQITLTFEGGKGVNFDAGKLTNYTLDGLKLEGTFNTSDGIAAVNEETLPDVLSMELDNVDASSVILFPQEVETLSLEVIYNNQLYDATLTVPEGALMAGTNYTYRVFINNREMNAGQADISKWNEVACDDVHAEMKDE